GTMDATVTQLIQTVVPTAPVGFALYYSNAAERAQETVVPTRKNLNGSYMNPEILLGFKNGGGAVNYYVGTAALANLQSTFKPAAWLVLDGTLPAAELSQLQSIAPVLTSLAAAMSFANAPLSYSTGLTGIGFYDQNDRLIVTVTNSSASALGGNVTLRTLPVGNYTATDLIAGTTIKFTIGATGGALPVNVARWDTQVLAIVQS